MCPDREPRSFADAAPDAARTEEDSAQGGPEGSGVGAARHGSARRALVAALSAWLLLIAIYAVLFALSGATVSRALRGGIANGIPDGLLALAVFEMARRRDASRVGVRRLILSHLGRALLLVGLAFAVKTLLLWIDMTLIEGQESFRLATGVIAWQTFISALIYAASAAASHGWLSDRRLRAEEARAARAEALRARAQLSALRAQLNPHFLFNMLHTVLGMVRSDPALAEEALEGLGDLLRYALRVHRDGVDRTALRHEWEFMETYLALEKIRLGDRLRVERRAEEGALDHPVPTFSLQPLVENAVRHGIAPRAAGGRISIDARRVDGALRLEVSNDGDGGSAATRGEGGLGLRVLRERLDVLYRGRARLSAGPEAPEGYRVVLILPAESDAPEADA